MLAAFANGRTTLEQAISAPRLHVNHVDDGDEPARIEAEQDMALPDLGLPVRRHHKHSMYFGGVSATYLDPSGQLGAAGDPVAPGQRRSASRTSAAAARRQRRPPAPSGRARAPVDRSASLAVVDAQDAQRRGVLLGLDALGDDLAVTVMPDATSDRTRVVRTASALTPSIMLRSSLMTLVA